MNKKTIFFILAAIFTILTTFNVNASIWDKIKHFNVVNDAPDFAKILDTKSRKKQFFAYLKPVIEGQNSLILQLRNRIKNNKLSKEFILKLAKKYRIKDNNISIQSLLKKIDIIPTSLALAQGAIESSWGRSRFSAYNNYYGIWCFKKGCGVVPNSRDSNAKHEVAVFKTISEATRKYMLNLNSHPAYTKLRDIRYNLRQNNNKIDGISLANGLEKYSGIGIKYIKILQQMITYNKL